MQPIQTLVAHAAWANRQLFAALRDVDAFESQKGAGLILRLLDHIHVVSRIFQAHLQGVSHGYKSTQSAVLPVLEELDRASEAIDRWYVDTTASLPPEELARPRDVRFRGASWRRGAPRRASASPRRTACRSTVPARSTVAGPPRGMPTFAGPSGPQPSSGALGDQGIQARSESQAPRSGRPIVQPCCTRWVARNT